MEAKALKKILVYSLVAVLLGLSLTLVPLATIKAQNSYNAIPQSIQERLKTLEGTHDSGATTYSASDLEIFAISFVIALLVYLLVKHLLPQHDYGRIRPYLY
jgi:hypothetical protein